MEAQQNDFETSRVPASWSWKPHHGFSTARTAQSAKTAKHKVGKAKLVTPNRTIASSGVVTMRGTQAIKVRAKIRHLEPGSPFFATIAIPKLCRRTPPWKRKAATRLGMATKTN